MSMMTSVFKVVVDGSWRASCLIVVFLTLRWLLRGHVSARILFWVWIVVALRLLIPFAVQARWSPFNLTRLAYRGAAAPDGVHPESGQSDAAPSRPAQMPAAHTLRPAATPAVRPVVLPSVQWMASAWCVGIAVLLVARFLAHRRFARRLRDCRSVGSEGAKASLAAETAATLGVRGVRVTITDSVGAPALYGIFPPRLLFPPGLLERLSAREVQLIVSHEMGHYTRRDLVAHALIQAAQILHWFNPLVWVAAHAARHDCELACDEHVLSRLGPTEPEAYGATLLKILGMARQTTEAPLGLGIVEQHAAVFLRHRVQSGALVLLHLCRRPLLRRLALVPRQPRALVGQTHVVMSAAGDLDQPLRLIAQRGVGDLPIGLAQGGVAEILDYGKGLAG